MLTHIVMEWDTDEGTLEIFNEEDRSFAVKLEHPREVKDYQEFFRTMGCEVDIYIDNDLNPTCV